jgi:hypothetical protein
VFAPAVAVARAALVGGSRPNFVRSRLAPPRKQRIGRRAAWSGIAVIIALVVGTLMWLDLRSWSNEVGRLDAQLKGMDKQVTAAKDLAGNVKMAGGWFDARTPVLDCLRDLTLIMPEGRAWATNVTLNEAGGGRLSGKAREGSDILTILDRLKANKRFSNVTHTSTPRTVRGGARETSFDIRFTYNRGG